MVDRRLDPVEIRDRLLEPAECLAHSGVELLEAFDFTMVRHGLPGRLVLGAQLIEQRRAGLHGDILSLGSDRGDARWPDAHDSPRGLTHAVSAWWRVPAAWKNTTPAPRSPF